MSEKKITIRLETKDDYRAVENLTRESILECLPPRLHGALCAAPLSG